LHRQLSAAPQTTRVVLASSDDCVAIVAERSSE
jgi:hypothetical protein